MPRTTHKAILYEAIGQCGYNHTWEIMNDPHGRRATKRARWTLGEREAASEGTAAAKRIAPGGWGPQFVPALARASVENHRDQRRLLGQRAVRGRP